MAATSKAPRMVTSIWPPRIIANDQTESTIEAPGRSVMRRLLASTRSGSARSGGATGPAPITPFSDWMNTSAVGSQIVGNVHGHAHAQVDQRARRSMSWAARQAIWRRLSGCMAHHPATATTRST